MNDTILMDENSKRYTLNLLLKLLLNNTILVQCYKFIDCTLDSYLKHGFDTASHVNLNYVVSDIIKTTITANEDVSNKIKLKECRIIFNSSKTIKDITFSYPRKPKKFQKSFIVSLRSLYWYFIIPCKLQMITEDNRIFNCEFDYYVIPNFTTLIENINYSSVGQYVLRTNNKSQENDVKITSHYKTIYTGYCRFDLRYKQGTNDKLFNVLDKNVLLVDNLLSAIRVCLVNEIGNFLFKHIFSHLINTESEEQEGILVRLRNDPISGHRSLRSPDFDINWQNIIYQKPFSGKIHYNIINMFTSVWNEVYQTYLKFNNMITVNHERLDEIRKIVDFKDDIDLTNPLLGDPGFDGDISDLNVRFGRIYKDINNRDKANRLMFGDPFGAYLPQNDPQLLRFLQTNPLVPPKVVLRPYTPTNNILVKQTSPISPLPTHNVSTIIPTHKNDK